MHLSHNRTLDFIPFRKPELASSILDFLLVKSGFVSSASAIVLLLASIIRRVRLLVKSFVPRPTYLISLKRKILMVISISQNADFVSHVSCVPVRLCPRTAKCEQQQGVLLDTSGQ